MKMLVTICLGIFLSCCGIEINSRELERSPSSNNSKVVQLHQDEIAQFIDAKAKEENAIENIESRKIVAGVDKEGRRLIWVLYTLEGFNGTNLYLQYIAVFSVSINGKAEYQTLKKIGGKNERLVELLSFEAGQLQLRIREYAPSDASCCPTWVRLVSLSFNEKDHLLYETDSK